MENEPPFLKSDSNSFPLDQSDLLCSPLQNHKLSTAN